MISNWLENLAADFWADAGKVPPFPRDLEHIIACQRPINVDPLPNLCIDRIRQRLAPLSPPAGLQVSNRRLHGCLVAFQDGATIFVEATLSAAERRVIVAHEFAHFLADYEYPRRRATCRVGPQLLRVFDGERPPTAAERLEATVARVELGAHVHFMERTGEGAYAEPTAHIERTANELALELLAPGREAIRHLRQGGPLPAQPQNWVTGLVEIFGLPIHWARPYATRLLGTARAQRSFSESLGL